MDNFYQATDFLQCQSAIRGNLSRFTLDFFGPHQFDNGVFIAMRIGTKSHRRTKSGFNRMELIVVLAVASILSIFFLTSAVKEQRNRAVCRANLHQVDMALQMYAQENHGLLPDCSTNNHFFSGRGWPWDLNTNLVADLEARGAGKQVLYCPSNLDMTNSGHWNIFRNDKARRVRVLGYCFLLNGIRAIPEDLRCTNLLGSAGRSPGQSELITDAVACNVRGGPRADATTTAAREDYLSIPGLWTDRTSHLRGLVNGIRPAGGNIAFEDGHVEWRDFHIMKHRIFMGNLLWDF